MFLCFVIRLRIGIIDLRNYLDIPIFLIRYELNYPLSIVLRKLFAFIYQVYRYFADFYQLWFVSFNYFITSYSMYLFASE